MSSTIDLLKSAVLFFFFTFLPNVRYTITIPLSIGALPSDASSFLLKK